MNQLSSCWCGNTDLVPFSPHYFKCFTCETLVVAHKPHSSLFQVVNDDRDFYGKEYWFTHQENDLGFPNIWKRARLDLPERCLYWLRTTLKYKLPPGRALELGCAHGGFVALLRWVGFDATGLELSPWIVHFASQIFGVPMLQGPIEDQQLERSSLAVIALMDVLEHLPDPVRTMQRCLDLLKPDGILLIQTPRYVEGETFEHMLAHNSPFLEQLREQEHLNLFSFSAIREFFRRLKAEFIVDEPAFFPLHDMFFVVGREPLLRRPLEEIEQALTASQSGRVVQGLLDLDKQLYDLKEKFLRSEADRKVRLEDVRKLTVRSQRLKQIAQARLEAFQKSENDRAARLKDVQKLTARVQELERDSLRDELESLKRKIHEIEVDRDKKRSSLEQLSVLAASRSERIGELKRATVARGSSLHELEEKLKKMQERLDVQSRQVQQLNETIAAKDEAIRDLNRKLEEALKLQNDSERSSRDESCGGGKEGP